MGPDAEHRTGPALSVASRNGQMVGFCVVEAPSRDPDTGPGVAEIAALNVRPAVWRSGVGTALMEAAQDALRTDGWAEVSLWVLERNDRALAFYGGLGFKPDGSSIVHQPSGQRELRMRRELNSRGAPTCD